MALSLKSVSCIYHLVQFKKNQAKIQALFDSASKVKTIFSVYAAKLDIKIQSIDIKA